MWDKDVAEIYDMVYRARGKDYRAEAKEITQLIRERRPDAESLLDVACGTGEHLLSLSEHFGHVEGLEISAGMLSVTRAKLPDVTLHPDNMCTFELGRSFDAITCLFSSVGYLPSLDALNAAVSRMVAHLSPGGVLVIEPWWSPDRFLDNYVSSHLVEEAGTTVARVSHTRRESPDSRHAVMSLHFVVASPTGIRHFEETHRIALFTQAEYLTAFTLAGCKAEFVEDVSTYCGLYIATR
jgi:ubiquinone/menaquinone biosynthesis C-methylase UbiE